MGRFNRAIPAVLLLGLIALTGCEKYLPHDTRSLLDPNLRRSEIVGVVAGFGTTFAGLPAFLAMLRRRSSAGMNPSMSAIMCIFQVIWVYYGLLIMSRPVIIWNLIGIFMNFLTVAAYRHFKRGERAQSRA